ncbi:MAG: hypothetical protein IKD10_03890, partial [Lentisphaeria bacterium]|nr:hypothetical protein [Lentisphaeria bacterium]
MFISASFASFCDLVLPQAICRTPPNQQANGHKKRGGAKLFCGEETFLKKGSLPHAPFSKN